MSETLKSADVTSTGTVVTTNGRIRALYVRTTGTEGTVVLKDGGASGTEITTLNTPAVEGGNSISLPGEGLPFGTDVHATLTNVDGLTVFYTDDSRGSVA